MTHRRPPFILLGDKVGLGLNLDLSTSSILISSRAAIIIDHNHYRLPLWSGNQTRTTDSAG